MEEEVGIDADSEIPTTHSFVYKEKSYPFNLDLFKIFSQYFNSNQPKENTINLLDENTSIFEASIPDFIKFCHAQKITLTRDNAPSLFKLSQKFDVPLLLKKTKKYISTHQKEVVVEMISMYHKDDDFQLQEFEEIITKNLTDYLDDDRLLTFPIPILHRIVTQYSINYKKQGNSNNSEQPQKLIEFLFKCLDHYGYKASVLFEHVDLLGSSGAVINRLFDGYSENFDFHFVNTDNVKTIYKLEGEIIDREKKMEDKISESQQEVMNVSQMVKDEIEKMRNQNEEEMKSINEMIQKMPLIVAQEIEKMKKKHDEEMNEKNELIEKMVKKHDEEMNKKNELLEKLMKQIEEMQTKHQDEIRRQHDEFEGSMKQINEKLDSLKIKRMFSNESDPKGLIAFLGEKVTISSGDCNLNFPLSSIRMYDSTCFYSSGDQTPSSDNSFIMFDFGPNKKIDLHSYFIRTSHGSASKDFHPKTWRIEGSNDGSSWTKLDNRLNNDSLNENHDKSIFEKYISQNIDKFLENYVNRMYIILITFEK